MSRYSHFTITERENLLVYVKLGKKNCEIAKLMGRSPSTISRELRRNAESRETYSAIQAEANYRTRRKRCVRKYKLKNKKYAKKVKKLLKLMWSPEQIANTPCELVVPSSKTIYRWIYDKYFVKPPSRL